MRVIGAFGQLVLLGTLFAIGGVLGIAIGAVILPISFYRGARAVHADGVVCRAEVIIHDPALAALAGPALVRLSGAFHGQDTTTADVLGLDLRMQRTASDDPRTGDQDLLFGTFESFATAGRDRDRTNVGDYLANHYSTVTPWWIAGHGPVILRLVPLPAAPATAAASTPAAPPTPSPPPTGRSSDRIARLDALLAADRASFALAIGSAERIVGVVRLTARIAADDRGLRASMFRQGRGVRPLGLRNGIRAAVYPMSQTARRLRRG